MSRGLAMGNLKEYSNLRDQDHVLIDIRDPTQFGICNLPNSKSILCHLNSSD